MLLKKLGVAIVMAQTAIAVHAQTSVQFYGIADAGVEYVNRVRSGAAGSPSKSVLRLQSGNAASSRFGFRGKEDLGGGLAAVFNLENGFSLDTGVPLQNGRLFGRQSYVGLAGGFGELQLGRQTTTIYDFALVFDPVSPARYASAAIDPAYAARADNALKYIGKLGQLNFGAQYSFGFDGALPNSGELAGAYRVGKEIGAHSNYTFGNIVLGAAYDRQNGTSVAKQFDKNERKVIGGAAKFNPVTLYTVYQRQTIQTAGASTKANFYWLGLRYQPIPAWTINSAIYVSDPDGGANKSKLFTVFGSYALSKRTDIYSQLGFNINQSTATFGMGCTVNPGENQAGLIVGMRHRFDMASL